MEAPSKNGFTTVEILITLFVGALLLGGGYQLYSIITQTSAETRNQTDASNIAYEQLRKYRGLISGRCGRTLETQNLNDDIPADTTLPGNLKMELTWTCPFGANEPISLLDVTLTYGEEGARRDVSHAMYSY